MAAVLRVRYQISPKEHRSQAILRLVPIVNAVFTPVVGGEIVSPPPR